MAVRRVSMTRSQDVTIEIATKTEDTEDHFMTTVQIDLPDQLAQEAERAGLLSPEMFEKWIREQLKAQRADQLFSAMDRMAAVNEPAVMSSEAVAEEIAAMRAERRAQSLR
jgi:hypothetical protein